MTAWKRYIRIHIDILLIAAGFLGYALLIRLISPDGLPHCLLHDLLHLYCPFCGGTRTFLALLRLDILSALRANPAVLLAALAAVVLDVRAFILICRKREEKLLPPHLPLVMTLYFLLYTLAVNAALLLGFDLLGDLAVYWQSFPTWRAALFFPISLLMSVSFLFSVSVLPAPQRVRTPLAILCACLLVTLALLLYGKWWLALGYSLVVLLFLLIRLIRKKRTFPS